jgi:NAD(P)-dependent dehydrogenase (short-subunit alcohol dehydrogenase family)
MSSMSMPGKVVVITGANSGVGLETAVGVAAQGATTVLACRNQEKAEAAAREVIQRTWNEDVHIVSLDLGDLASVRKAADEILTRWDRLDVLDNNAGGTWTQRQETAQGLEYTMGVCHVAHFYLTRLLLGRLEATAPSRVINVTSVGHHAAFKGMRFDDLQSEKSYDGMEVYCRAKLANVLFTRGLAQRTAGTGLTANTAHPGWVRSRFGMDGDTAGKSAFGFRAMRPFQISPRRGAKTTVFLATSPEVATRTGEYWVRSKPGHMGKQGRNDVAAVRLWDASDQILAAAGFPVP